MTILKNIGTGFLGVFLLFSTESVFSAEAKGKPMGPTVSRRGTVFRVWAQNARSIDVIGDFNGWSAGRDPMVCQDFLTGAWEATVRSAKHGDSYQFLINGNLYKRDPRGQWVNGDGTCSVVYDHSRFDWQGDESPKIDPRDLVLYELHPGTFYDPHPNDGNPATFYEAIKRLRLLKKLGINAISLMPVHEFDGKHSWGYNPCDLYAVERAYGGPDGLKTFVQACHQLGMVVHLDIVHNHYGPQNLDMLQFDGTGYPQDGGMYFYHGSGIAMTPWGPRPKFETPQVRQFIRDNVDLWLRDYHIDGFRWDSTINIRAYDMGVNELPAGAAMLEEINNYIRTNYPGRLSIAEDSVDIGNFDGSWHYDFHHELMPVITAKTDDARDMLAVVNAMSYRPASMLRVVYTDNHDEAGKINGQVRIATDIDPKKPDSAYARKLSGLASLLTLTAPGIPLLFMGNEMQESGTFHDDRPLHWGNMKINAGLVRLHKDLISLRRNLRRTGDSLKGNEIQFPLIDNKHKTVVYWRWDENYKPDKTVVAINFSGEQREVVMPFPSQGIWTTRLNTDWDIYGGKTPSARNNKFELTSGGGKVKAKLPPYSARIFSLSKRPPQEVAALELEEDEEVETSEPVETGPMTMYQLIALAGDFNEWSPTALPLQLVSDFTWEGRFELPACETASILLLADGTNLVKWGGGGSFQLPVSTELEWYGDEMPLASIPAATYLVQFNENTKVFEMAETEAVVPEPTPTVEPVPVEAKEESAYRVWTSKKGKKIKAKLLKYANKKVLLETPKGKKIPVRLSTLIREDVSYVRSWKKNK